MSASQPTAYVSPTDTMICPEDTIVLIAGSYTGDESKYYYSWTPDTFFLNSSNISSSPLGDKPPEMI